MIRIPLACATACLFLISLFHVGAADGMFGRFICSRHGINLSKGECVRPSNYASDLQFHSVTAAIL